MVYYSLSKKERKETMVYYSMQFLRFYSVLPIVTCKCAHINLQQLNVQCTSLSLNIIYRCSFFSSSVGVLSISLVKYFCYCSCTVHLNFVYCFLFFLETKNQWARDDPAFIVICSLLLVVATLAYCVAYVPYSATHFGLNATTFLENRKTLP